MGLLPVARPPRATAARRGVGGGARRRPDRWTARGLVALGVAVVALLAANLLQVARLRRTAPAHLVTLDHAGTVGTGGGPLHTLLVIGDSAADGYGIADACDALPRRVGAALAARTGRTIAVRAVAVSGTRTDDVLRDQVPLVATHQPDTVVIGVGVNDALGRVPAPAVRRRTAALLDAVATAAPDAARVMIPCPDLSAAPGLPAPLSWLVGWRCRAIARAQLAAAQAAGVPAVRWTRRPRPDEFGPDGFHPGREGHRAIAALVVAALDRHQEAPWISD